MLYTAVNHRGFLRPAFHLGVLLLLIARTWYRILSGALTPNYGTP